MPEWPYQGTAGLTVLSRQLVLGLHTLKSPYVLNIKAVCFGCPALDAREQC